MNSGMDADFEAYRRDRRMRQRQDQPTERPGGHSEVWEQLEQHDNAELKDQIINAEVDDFFQDATRLAANIVTKVAENRQQEVSEKLRREMEEFLFESIRHATNMIAGLDLDSAGELAEQIVVPSLKNLNREALDEFRAEGTAQLSDKHFGQDPFETELDALGPVAGDKAGKSKDKSNVDADISGHRMSISDSELTLDYASDVEPDFAADEFDTHIGGEPAIQKDEPESTKVEDSEPGEGEAPLAALQNDPAADDGSENPEKLAEKIVEAMLDDGEPSAAKTPAKTPATSAVGAAHEQSPASHSASDEKIRFALKLLVKEGLMTKDQARAAYKARTTRSTKSVSR